MPRVRWLHFGEILIKQIILHSLDPWHTYHIFPPTGDDTFYKLIIGNKLQPGHNVEADFDTQDLLDALLFSYKVK